MKLFSYGALAVLCQVNRFYLSASIFIWWFGFNLFGTSQYIADARAKEIDLSMFGPKVIHDWEYILNETGLIQQDLQISFLIKVTGLIICLAGCWFFWNGANQSSKNSALKD